MDVNKLLNGFLGSQGADAVSQAMSREKKPGSGLPSGLVGGAAAGGLIALLAGSKSTRKLGSKAIKVGGLALVGGLAYKAYSDWKANKTPGKDTSMANLPQPTPNSAFDVESDRDSRGEDFRLVLVQSMIAAANADGHIDTEEHALIRQQLSALELGAEERTALYGYFSNPADVSTIAELARSDEQRAEIYLASVLSMDPDTDKERAYLDELAERLGLPSGLRGHLDAEASMARSQIIE